MRWMLCTIILQSLAEGLTNL